MRTALLTGLMLTFLLAGADGVFAQYPSSQYGSNSNAYRPRVTTPRRPTVSPYINLLGGRGLGEEYYGRVRPQQEFRRTASQMNRSISDLQRQQQLQNQQLTDVEMGATGHVTSFMTHSQYFGVSMSPQGLGSVKRAAAPTLKSK